jgi:hypothetical protein
MSLTSNFTRPANTTAYTSGDLVANHVTAASVVPLSWEIGQKGPWFLRRARIAKSEATTTNASFRLHLYESSPTCTNGDNGAWLTTISNYIGSIDITVDKVFASDATGEGVPAVGSDILITNIVGSQVKTLYGLLEARGAYTPGSEEVFTVVLEQYV